MKPKSLATAAIPCCFAFLAILGLFACEPQVIIVVKTQTPPPPTSAPTLLPHPDALDVVAVQQEMTWLINAVRIDRALQPFQWDETLQELAERQAWKIVLGEKPFDHIDNWPATQLGEPVAELRACTSDNVTTPERVARAAVEHWLGAPDLAPSLLGRWERVGVGFDWGCPLDRGVMLLVLLAGGSPEDRG